MGYEYSDLKGLKVADCDSDLISNVETTIHGGYDGYIYKQDSGNVFTRASGTSIIDATYRSPDIVMGDAGIRKHMQRVIVNYAPESTLDADLFVRYDYESKDSARPAAYELDSTDIAAVY